MAPGPSLAQEGSSLALDAPPPGATGTIRAPACAVRPAPALAPGPGTSYLERAMNYLLALFLPPLSILIAGRPFVAILTFLIWIPAIVFSGGLTHPMFIVLAWILVYQSGEERRARRLGERRD